MTILFGTTTIILAGMFGYSLYVLKIVREENKELKRNIRVLRAFKGTPEEARLS